MLVQIHEKGLFPPVDLDGPELFDQSGGQNKITQMSSYACGKTTLNS